MGTLEVAAASARESLSSRGAQEIGGEELALITDGIVRLYSADWGRGPTRAKTYLLENCYLLTVMGDTMTRLEQRLVSSGKAELVREVRRVFRETMAEEFSRVVQDVTGRSVISSHSQLSTEADIGLEFFLLAE